MSQVATFRGSSCCHLLIVTEATLFWSQSLFLKPLLSSPVSVSGKVAFRPFLLSVIITLLLYHCHKTALSLSHIIVLPSVCNATKAKGTTICSFKMAEKKRKDMEVSSNGQSSNDSKPLQTECHVADANSCSNSKSTRASLRLKRKREQSYEAYHEEPQAKCNKVKATYDRNPEVKRSQVKAAFNKDREAKRSQVKAAFNKDREAKCSQVKAAFNKDRQAKRNQVKAAFNKDRQAKRNKVKAAFDKDRAKK